MKGAAAIPSGYCYACDKRAIGVTRRYAGGRPTIEAACARHADPTIKAVWRCIYCNTPVRAGSIPDGDMYAHKKCYEADLKANS